MPVLKTDQIKPDSILGTDVLSGGQLLLKKGLKLTAGHIRILKSRGVEAIYVMEPGQTSDRGDVVITPDIEKKAWDRVMPRFRHVKVEHPAVKAVLQVCFQQELMKLQDEAIS